MRHICLFEHAINKTDYDREMTAHDHQPVVEEGSDEASV